MGTAIAGTEATPAITLEKVENELLKAEAALSGLRLDKALLTHDLNKALQQDNTDEVKRLTQRNSALPDEIFTAQLAVFSLKIRKLDLQISRVSKERQDYIEANKNIMEETQSRIRELQEQIAAAQRRFQEYQVRQEALRTSIRNFHEEQTRLKNERDEFIKQHMAA